MGSYVSITSDSATFVIDSRNANERRMKSVVQFDKNGIRNSAGGYYWFLEGDYIYEYA